MKIYEPKGRAREYSPLALNYFKGCTHGCEYCYVPKMLGRFHVGYDHSEVFCPDEKAFHELEVSAKKMRGCEKQILLSFTGDPYCDSRNDVTTRVLEILNKYEHKVAILTKGGIRSLIDIDLIKSFGDRIKVGATLTFSNELDSRKWEPGGSLPNERIDALRTFSENGVKTWASFEPVVIPEQSLYLLSIVSEFIDHVRIGKLNNYKGLDKFIDWGDFLKSAVAICREKELMFYIKDDLRLYNKGVSLSDSEVDEDFLNL